MRQGFIETRHGTFQAGISEQEKGAFTAVLLPSRPSGMITHRYSSLDGHLSGATISAPGSSPYEARRLLVEHVDAHEFVSEVESVE